MDQTVKVAVAVSDLFFAARIRETAAQLGVTSLPLGKAETIEEFVRRERPDLLIIDLNDGRFNAIEAIQGIKGSNDISLTRIVGFLSHVQTDLFNAAVRAGCDQVLPRSKFTQTLPQILTGAGESSTSQARH